MRCLLKAGEMNPLAFVKSSADLESCQRRPRSWTRQRQSMWMDLAGWHQHLGG